MLTIIIAAAILLVSGAVIYSKLFSPKLSAEEVVQVDVTEVLRGRLENIGELNTAEYMCTYVQDYSSSYELKGWKIPLTAKKFTISYDGVVKAGIKDLSMVAVTRANDSTIIVTLPPMQITNSTIGPDSLKVYDESHNPLNQISVEDVNTAQATLIDEMVQRAVDNGIKEQALENAKIMLSAMLQCPEAEGCNIIFKG